MAPRGSSTSSYIYPPLENADAQYRKLQDHAVELGEPDLSKPVLLGTFDQSKIEGFDPLSRVPLGPYQPTAAAPADAASSKALGGTHLLPDMNLGGLVTQPVQLITTLAALPARERPLFRAGGTSPRPDQRDQGPGRRGHRPRSGLAGTGQGGRRADRGAHRPHRGHRDRVLPRADYDRSAAGQVRHPALLLSEGWIKKGVVVTILDAVDRSSVTLFVLILVVCALFVANSATAAVRGRRQELGVLACLGWTRPRLFAAVLGEIALIGLAAGVLGAVASPPLAAALGLHASAARAALAIPVAVVLAVAAGAVPAWLAARADPAAAIRPPVLAVRRARQPSGITGLAVINVLRTPGRALIGAVSLAIGVSALTLLTAITLAFRGAATGTLLGNVVTVQVRGVDYVAVTATVILGVLAVADALLTASPSGRRSWLRSGRSAGLRRRCAGWWSPRAR